MDIGDRERLLEIAASAGLDRGELEAYLMSGQAEAKLNESLSEVLDRGIDGVPTFIIGGRKVVGAQPFEVLEKVVEEELARSG